MGAEPLRIAAVSYLNTLPLIEGLEKVGGVELVTAPPAGLLDLLLSRRAEVGLLSVVDVQRSPEPLAVIPAGMIGCDGPTMTVRLFSRAPLDTLTEVHADAESHTSVALVQVLLQRLYGRRVTVRDFDASARARGGGAWPEAVLLIGDKVVTAAPPTAEYPHGLDLGEAWRGWTGLPFVYAVWACRAAEAASERIGLAASILDRQRRHNRTRLDWIIAKRAEERGWPVDAARRYLAELLRYDPDPPTSGGATGPAGVGLSREREAIERFFDEASSPDLGLIPRRRPTLWVEPPSEKGGDGGSGGVSATRTQC